MNDYFYKNEPVIGTLISNSDFFEWNVNNKIFKQRDVPLLTYNNTGTHNYKVTATSILGCTETLEKIVTIISKVDELGDNICLLDTTDSELGFYNNHIILSSVVDTKGDLVHVGCASDNNDIDVGFIYKQTKEGKKIWEIKPAVHDPFYDYFCFIINSATLDDNNDIYVTGNFTAISFTFMGIKITHGGRRSTHPFVAKISSNGELVWFLSSSEESSDGYYFGLGGSDIKYSDGNLYLSGRFFYKAVWKNHLGQTVSMLNPEKIGEYAIIQINDKGTSIKALAGFGKSFFDYTNVPYRAAVEGLCITNPSGLTYNSTLLGPKLSILPNQKIAVYGILKTDSYFDSLFVSPIQFNTGASNPNVGTEFTATVDIVKSKWESVRLEGIKSLRYYHDQTIKESKPLALFTNKGEKISVLQAGGTYILDTIKSAQNEPLIICGEKISILKKIDRSGSLVWKWKIIGGVIYELYPSQDTNVVVLVGKSQYGIEIEGGTAGIGLNSGQSSDLFVMGFDILSGDVLWFERMGSKYKNDVYLTSTLNSCNELTIVGSGVRQSNPLIAPDTINSLRKSLAYMSDAPYIFRIPLNGTCNFNNCKILTSLPQNISITNSVYLYPNPATDEFSIKGEIAPCNKVVVRDLNGRILKIVQSQSITEINVAELNSGLYLIETFTGDQSKIIKLNIIK
ncbi:MAG: T9SS type A sorting domain-containing protein [Opitutaceae bacterium]|nr:T9SS type A sorting domain-containing protein [Cytophagales bacterium]